MHLGSAVQIYQSHIEMWSNFNRLLHTWVKAVSFHGRCPVSHTIPPFLSVAVMPTMPSIRFTSCRHGYWCFTVCCWQIKNSCCGYCLQERMSSLVSGMTCHLFEWEECVYLHLGCSVCHLHAMLHRGFCCKLFALGNVRSNSDTFYDAPYSPAWPSIYTRPLFRGHEKGTFWNCCRIWIYLKVHFS